MTTRPAAPRKPRARSQARIDAILDAARTLLAAEGVAIIMVSSELAEVLGVSDRVLVIGDGQLRGDFINQGLTQEQVLAAALSQNNNNRKTA